MRNNPLCSWIMQKAVEQEVEEGLGSILRTSLAEMMDNAAQRINHYLVDKC